MNKGERWAYEIPKKYNLVEVVVDRIGTKRPPRVLISFVGDEFEGASEWVPPSRLKTPWAGVDAYLVREAAWDRLRAHSADVTEVESFAVEHVLIDRLPESVATRMFNHGNFGLIAVHDWSALETLTGGSRADLIKGESLLEDGDTICSWLTTLEIAKTYTVNHAGDIMRELDKYDEKLRHEAIYGRVERRGGREHFTGPEHIAAFYDEYLAAMIEIIRGWGGEAEAKRNEVDEMRRELWEATALVNRAVHVLLATGNEEEAWRLHSQVYPDARRQSWKSQHQLKIESDERLREEREREAESARERRHLDRQAAERQIERERARLLDYSPPPWAIE
jgi:hypothetical protein